MTIEVFAVLFLLSMSISISMMVLMIVFTSRDENPLNDSSWNYNKEDAFRLLQRYVSNKQEVLVDILGINSLKDVSNNSFKNGLCFITNKAYYFIGRVYQKKLFTHWKNNMQHRIISSELKGVKVVQCLLYRYIALFVGFCFDLYLTLQMAGMDSKLKPSAWEDAEYLMLLVAMGMIGRLILDVIGIIATLIIFLFAKRRVCVCLEFVSQTFYFPINTLGKQEIKNFFESVSKVQETTQNEIKDINMPPQPVTVNKGKVEALTELSKLYEQSLISEEEFNKLKSEIINNQ